MQRQMAQSLLLLTIFLIVKLCNATREPRASILDPLLTQLSAAMQTLVENRVVIALCSLPAVW
jgi:hypothetical protein